jgi:hypothetical protein
MANGWTPERRASQAALIHRWRPWERSTGPRTEAGKRRTSMNAELHGERSRKTIEIATRLSDALETLTSLGTPPKATSSIHHCQWSPSRP